MPLQLQRPLPVITCVVDRRRLLAALFQFADQMLAAFSQRQVGIGRRAPASVDLVSFEDTRPFFDEFLSPRHHWPSTSVNAAPHDSNRTTSARP